MKEIRKEFPALADSVYLNTAANGLLPQSVYEWRRQQDEELLNKPDKFRMQHKKIIHQTKQLLADFFDSQISDIAMVPNFSHGINLVLEGVEKGVKVLLLKEDYPSVNWPVENRDFEVIYTDIDENLESNILQTIEKHRPSVFLFSMVQWLSGIKIDFEFLRKIKSEFPDILFIGDGTQYLGTEKFSFQKSALDIMACSGYKWLTAGFGNGFLMMKENAKQKIRTFTAGFNSAPDFETGLEALPYIKHFEPGHLDSLSYGSIAESISFVQKQGVEKCYTNILQLSTKAKTELAALGLLKKEVVNRVNHSSIFNIKAEEGLFEKLNQNKISTSPRGGGIRLSFHYYNDENDLDKLIEVLKK